jgi:ATP-binding cassette, subfamily F, member 3
MVSLNQITVTFGGFDLFRDVNFMVNPRERIGLVGKNGAGKSTLLRLIVGEMFPTSGTIGVPKDVNIGYLPQQMEVANNRSVIDETMQAFSETLNLAKEIEHLTNELGLRTDYESDSYIALINKLTEKSDRFNMIGGTNLEGQAEVTLQGLGFKRSDFARPTKEFSGGWRMRIELAKILLRRPDVLLLDEPTNHLDIESIQWLEDYLKVFSGAVVLISHDRAFLDNITERTIELSLGKAYDYRVPYSKYVQLRQERREQQMAAYRNQQKQIEDTMDFVERFRYKATKSNQVQSRLKQLEKLDIIEVDDEDASSLHITFPPAPRSGEVAVKVDEVTKRYGANTVFSHANLVIERGEKVAFVGRNGEGKTTMSRIIVGNLDYEGKLTVGHNVSIGYFAQNQDEIMDPSQTVLETIDRVATGNVRTKMRDILGAFLFRGDDVDKKVSVLSGGERNRLAMVKLMLQPYNLLVLDEPTNHLDMRSKDILKNAIQKFDGTVIVVSHDREFLSSLVSKVFEFRDGKVKEHLGGVTEFLNKRRLENLKALETRKEVDKQQRSEKPLTDSKQLWAERKEIDRQIRKMETKTEEVEAEIHKIEKRIELMDAMLSSPDGAAEVDSDFFNRYTEMKKHLEKMMEEWEQLAMEAEKVKEKRKVLE